MNDDIGPQITKDIRTIKGIAVGILAALVVLVAFVVYNQIRFWRFFHHTGEGPASVSLSWRNVRDALDRQNFDGALRVAQSLADDCPDYYYGYSFFGTIHLAKGELEEAEKAYARAYELWPSEENRKALEAVRKRLGRAPDAPE